MADGNVDEGGHKRDRDRDRGRDRRRSERHHRHRDNDSQSSNSFERKERRHHGGRGHHGDERHHDRESRRNRESHRNRDSGDTIRALEHRSEHLERALRHTDRKLRKMKDYLSDIRRDLTDWKEGKGSGGGQSGNGKHTAPHADGEKNRDRGKSGSHPKNDDDKNIDDFEMLN